MINNPKTIKEELRPLKDLLEIIKNKVDKTETFQNVTMQQVRNINDQQSVMNRKLDDLEERLDDPDSGLRAIKSQLDAATSSVISIEKDIKAYADMYKINDGNIRWMQKRLEPLEENSGIITPPEFQLQPLPEAA